MRRFLSFGIYFLCLIGNVYGIEPKQITLSGKVVDEAGKPLAGVTVEAFQMTVDMARQKMVMQPTGSIVTGADGTFKFTAPPVDMAKRAYGTMVITHKTGYGLGWDQWQASKDQQATIRMGKPGIFAGVVVDETGQPIPNAQVKAMAVRGEERNMKLIGGHFDVKALTTQTDSKGRFEFLELPADVTTEFLTSAPGRAKVSTMKTQSYPFKFQFTTGRKDIKIVMPKEAGIKGIVIEKESRKPIPNIALAVAPVRQEGWMPNVPDQTLTDKDGKFSIGELGPGQYNLAPVMAHDKTAEWVAAPFNFSAVAGRTVSGITLEMAKGGILEVVVKTQTDKKPVAEAMVSLHEKDKNAWLNHQTDKNGIARIRLMPGEYEIGNVSKYEARGGGFQSVSTREIVAIEENKTKRVEVTMKGQEKIRGIVRDAAGKPVAGAQVVLSPFGLGSWVTTDAEGKFEVAPQNVGGPENVTPYLAVRHLKRNLAAVVPVEEGAKIIKIKLVPGVIFAGQVTDLQGKPLSGVNIRVYITGSRYSTQIDNNRESTLTDANGKYEIKAIPPEQKYYINAGKDGYGQKSSQINLTDSQATRIDVEKLALDVANMSVSGSVVDEAGTPMAQVQVYAYGQGQPHARGTTDAAGKFTLEKLCKGSLQVSANLPEGNKYGNTEANAGDKDVRVVLQEQQTSRQGGPSRNLPLLIGKPLPKLDEFKITLSPDMMKNKSLLVCFWDYNGRPSRHSLKKLAAMADVLAKKNVLIVSVQVSTADEKAMEEWLEKSKVTFPAGIVPEGGEKKLLTWGVRSVPWLILTDQKGMVTAEGFSVDEINQKAK